MNTADPMMVPNPTLDLAMKTPMSAVKSSGAEPPAAMNVAPATSSSMPYRSTSTSKAGTKKSSHTMAMATKVYSTPNACRKTAPRRSCDSVNKSGGYREPSPSDLSRRRPDACARRPRLSERAEPALTSDPNAPVAEPQVAHATRNAHANTPRRATLRRLRAAGVRPARLEDVATIPANVPRHVRTHARVEVGWGRRSDRCRISVSRAENCRIRHLGRHAHVALYALKASAATRTDTSRDAAPLPTSTS